MENMKFFEVLFDFSLFDYIIFFLVSINHFLYTFSESEEILNEFKNNEFIKTFF